MKNQSARGADEVSLVCLGAMDWAESCSAENVGQTRAKSRGSVTSCQEGMFGLKSACCRYPLQSFGAPVAWNVCRRVWCGRSRRTCRVLYAAVQGLKMALAWERSVDGVYCSLSRIKPRYRQVIFPADGSSQDSVKAEQGSRGMIGRQRNVETRRDCRDQATGKIARFQFAVSVGA